MRKKILDDLSSVIDDKYKILKNLLRISKSIKISIEIIYKKLRNGGTIFICGNGGSAADSQHLVAEFLVRLRSHINRKPLSAVALTMDSSTLTACANDYGFKYVFSRNLEALSCKNKDVLIAISTSGNSENVIEALKYAKKNRILTVGFLGGSGGKAKKLCDIPLIVNSYKTARIQECHIFLGHYIAEKIEDKFLKKSFGFNLK